MQRELATLEARHAQLSAQAAAPAPAPVAIHPNASEIYRKKVAALHDALTSEDTRAGAAEALRALIDAIRVTPDDEGNTIEIVGELGALLQLASNSKNAASIGEAARSIKLVAGPATALICSSPRGARSYHRQGEGSKRGSATNYPERWFGNENGSRVQGEAAMPKRCSR